jgi:hypothetical protein
VEDDSRKLGVKRWRRKALDRVEWASIVREGKAKLKGPEGYRKKKKSFVTRIFIPSNNSEETCIPIYCHH